MMSFYFRVSLFLLFSIIATNSFSQSKIKFGLRAGANFAGMAGPSEIGDSSNRLEKYTMSPKVTVAACVRIPFSKRFGLSAEIGFSQRGAYYRYTNDVSYLKGSSTGLLFEGHKRTVGLNVINGYIEVPVLFLAELIDDRMLLEFGPSVSFLVSSRALGTLKYIDPDYSTKIMEYDLDYKYLKDTLGGFVGTATLDGKIDGTTVKHPKTVGAYYFNDEKKGTFYNIVDFGLNLGISYYFTQGLRIGMRGYFGLFDITSNKMDYDQQKLDANKQFILRTDRDTNFGIQIFIGLQF